jgi:hypothetical protein
MDKMTTRKKPASDELGSFIDRAGDYISEVARGAPGNKRVQCTKDSPIRVWPCECKKCKKERL